METSQQGRSRRRDSHSFNEIDDDTSSHRYNPSPSPSSSTTIHWGPPPAPAAPAAPAPAEGPSSSPNSPAAVEKEHMFDKVVTPSDVGKLNRLVIPKQHAERHLPVLRDGGPESVLISFEDAGDGKVWRFRYSYWNSSQSYVLTKGWSRFVKEKGLVAGDTVRFLRDKDGGEGKLYVECRGTNGSEGGVKVVRLFGVDIFRGGDEMMMKRKRGLDLDQVMESSRFFKKKFVGVL